MLNNLALIFISVSLIFSAVTYTATDQPITIAAVGDIMLGRSVAKTIEKSGPNYLFENVKQLIGGADIAFGNLESPLSLRGEPIPGKGIWLRGTPDSIEGLVFAGFDVLSIGNNHILDFDSPALIDTCKTVESAGINIVGAGEDLKTARQLKTLKIRGTKVAFLGYSDFYDIYWDRKYKRRFSAGENLPGVAPLKPEIIIEDIKKAKKTADIVVVSLHWGEEGTFRPTPRQKDTAHKIIDAGADILLGHHPHVIQGIEIYKGRLIAYSLGNFVFDQYKEQNRQSMVLLLTVKDRKISEVSVVPVYITEHQPRLVQGDQAEKILDMLIKLSAELDTELENIGGIGKFKIIKLN